MILISGCSFTAGMNSWVNGFLKHGYNFFNKNELVYPYTIYNSAMAGSSNSIIRKKIFYYISNLDKILMNQKINYAIIQWSTIDRWDYPVLVTNERSKIFPRMDSCPERLGKINYMISGTNPLGYAKEFYEKYYSIYGSILDTLESIYHTQLYLKENKIPYKMITIGNIFKMDVAVRNLIRLQNPNNKDKGNYSILDVNNIFDIIEEVDETFWDIDIVKSLLQKIDFSNFIFTDDLRINGFGGGIIEWFYNKKQKMEGVDFHPSLHQSLYFFDNFLYPLIKSDLEKFTNFDEKIFNIN